MQGVLDLSLRDVLSQWLRLSEQRSCKFQRTRCYSWASGLEFIGLLTSLLAQATCPSALCDLVQCAWKVRDAHISKLEGLGISKITAAQFLLVLVARGRPRVRPFEQDGHPILPAYLGACQT